MKLSDVIKIWEILHDRNTGDIGYSDLDEAIDTVVGVENDYGDCRKPITIPPSEEEKHE